MSKMLPLPTEDFLRANFGYDAEAGRFWRLKDGYEGYLNNIGYRQIAIAGRIFSVHRLAWKMAHGADPIDCVDHINGDRADNRSSNLRSASVTENNRNRKLQSNSSGVKGVTWSDLRKRWMAMLIKDKKPHFIGRYHCFGRAVKAANAARRELHGEYSRAL